MQLRMCLSLVLWCKWEYPGPETTITNCCPPCQTTMAGVQPAKKRNNTFHMSQILQSVISGKSQYRCVLYLRALGISQPEGSSQLLRHKLSPTHQFTSVSLFEGTLVGGFKWKTNGKKPRFFFLGGVSPNENTLLVSLPPRPLSRPSFLAGVRPRSQGPSPSRRVQSVPQWHAPSFSRAPTRCRTCTEARK